MTLKGLAPGSQLHVLLSDQGSRSDVPAFLKKQGHSVETSITAEGALSLVVTKSEG